MKFHVYNENKFLREASCNLKRKSSKGKNKKTAQKNEDENNSQRFLCAMDKKRLLHLTAADIFIIYSLVRCELKSARGEGEYNQKIPFANQLSQIIGPI